MIHDQSASRHWSTTVARSRLARPPISANAAKTRSAVWMAVPQVRRRSLMSSGGSAPICPARRSRRSSASIAADFSAERTSNRTPRPAGTEAFGRHRPRRGRRLPTRRHGRARPSRQGKRRAPPGRLAADPRSASRSQTSSRRTSAPRCRRRRSKGRSGHVRSSPHEAAREPARLRQARNREAARSKHPPVGGHHQPATTRAGRLRRGFGRQRGRSTSARRPVQQAGSPAPHVLPPGRGWSRPRAERRGRAPPPQPCQ